MQHIIESSVNILNSGDIQLKHLPIYLIENINNNSINEDIREIKPLNQEIESLEKQLIINALKKLTEILLLQQICLEFPDKLFITK